MILTAIATLLLLGAGDSDIASRVVDSKGEGIAGAKVTLLKTSDAGDRIAAKAESGADGRFTFSTAEIQERQIPSAIIIQVPGKGLTYAMLRGNPAPKEIEVLPATRARVTLLGPDGKPAAGIVVLPRLLVEGDQSGPPSFLSFPAELSKEMAATTDANGRCEIQGLPQKMRVSFDVEDDRFTRLSGAPLLLDADESTDIPPFALKPGASASGRVTRNGQGVPGIKVGAQEGRGDGWGEAVTDGQGNYTLRRLAPGTYNIALDLPNPEESGVAPANEGVVVTLGASLAGKNFDLKPGATVQGQVTDDSGKPVKDVYIGIYGPAHPRSSAWVQNVRTDADGKYTATVPPGEQFVYVMSGPGSPNKTVQAKLGTPTVVNFQIAIPVQPSVISGKIVDKDGNPVNGAKVRMFEASGQRYSDVDFAKTDKEGQFSFQAMSLPVVLRATDGQSVNSKLVKLAKAGTVQITLDQTGGQVTGKVIDEKGQPVKGAIVKCLEWNEGSGMYIAEITTGEDGGYAISGLFPDLQYSIVAYARGYGPQDVQRMKVAQRVELPPLKLPVADSFVAGQIVDESGKPVLGANIEITQSGYDHRTTTDAQGRFRLDSLPKGEISVYISLGQAYLNHRLTAGEANAVLVLKQPPKTVEAAPKTKEILDLPAPALKAGDWVNSKPMTLQTLKGKVVVIDFWAIWCSPCRAALPEVKKLAAKYKANKGVFVMGLHDSTTWESELIKFAKKEGITYPLAIDKTSSNTQSFGQTALQYGIEGIPTVVVIDQKGVVRYRGHSVKEAELMVARLLKISK